MFILHTSNKTENLLAHLATVIATQPLRSPFTTELFLVQSQGMERWLCQQLALHFDVWANYQFLSPNKFFSEIAQSFDVNLNDQAFQRQQVVWRLEALLRNLDKPALLPLAKFISGEESALKRFQLAQRLAQIFDQYQILRPELLSAWQQGQRFTKHPSEIWQRDLWLAMTEQIGSTHRGKLWQQAIARMDKADSDTFAECLPERVSIFGLNTMPPLFIAFLQSLSRHSQVHLYLLNPAQGYWSDLESSRQIVRRNLRSNSPTEISIKGHPLLASLGQQGREFQQMLLEQADFFLEYKSFEPPIVPIFNNLQQLQNDLLENHQTRRCLNADNSIGIHACHGKMREVQVIKDQILAALDKSDDLALRDIVVMAPDIQVYEPFISAVFADIDHAIADRSLRLSNQTLDIFIAYLRLSLSRFGWQAVLELLEHANVYPAFGLTEQDLPLIRHWVQETNIRWGRSAEHKQSLALPAIPNNTWASGLERLLMGYSMGIDKQFIDGVLTYSDIEGTSAQALGGLYDYLQFLTSTGKQFASTRTLIEWVACLTEQAQRLFVPVSDAHSRELNELNDLLLQLATGSGAVHEHQHPVELEIIIAWLETTVSEQKTTSGFLRGQLTFCSMLPMRSIPFKVVALIGLNDGEFPKTERRATFDLLDQQFIKGDRSRRADDRYQFLEVLLSVRQQLIISYIGQSSSQNEILPPSVVVDELLDVLSQQYHLDDLLVCHPLQPFSRHYFSNNARLFSYAKNSYQTAQAFQQQSLIMQDWWQGQIPVPEQQCKLIEIADLLRFFNNPQKFFIQRVLLIRLSGVAQLDPETEPFTLDKLAEYQINQRLIAALLQGDKISSERLQAEGCWPTGHLGDLLIQEKNTELGKFVNHLESLDIGTALVDQTININIDINIDGIRLVGKLENCYVNGSLLFRYAQLKAKDFMQAWLQHLLINQLQAQDTHLVMQNQRLLFTDNDAQSGADYLSQLITIYRQGQLKPSPFLLTPALAYIQQALVNKKSNKQPIDVAREQLQKEISNGYEPELALIYRLEAIDELLDDEFEHYCNDLLLPVWLASSSVAS